MESSYHFHHRNTKKAIFTNIIFKLKITDWRLIVQGDK